MKRSYDILAEFGIPADEARNAADIRAILARLVDAGEIPIGELQCARDMIRKSGCGDERAYLLIAAMFIALHDGEASLKLTGDGKLDAGVIVRAGRIDRATDELSCDAEEFERLARLHWPAAVATAQAISSFIAIVASSPPDACPRRFFFRRYYNATVRVRDLLANMSSQPHHQVEKASLESCFSYSAGHFTLSDEQKTAVAAAVSNRLAVITGGPGTGKTTIVCSILRSLVRNDGFAASDIALAAPTGRAAQRMGEALRKQCLSAGDDDIAPHERSILNSLNGSTIHSLLGGLPPKWRHGEDNRLPCKIVIVDEASMVDLLLMRSLLVALRDDCRLVLLGDANQLPPVEAGAVLGDMVNSIENVVALTESRRFKGPLRICAEEFNNGKIATLTAPSSRLPDDWQTRMHDAATQNTCMWRGSADARKEIDAFLREWADVHGLGKDGKVTKLAKAIDASNAVHNGEMTDEAKALFDALDASRILTVVRNGPFGAQHANENLLCNRLGFLPRENRLVAPGIPVIILANTPALGLFNGDIGVTIAVNGSIAVIFPRGDKAIVCPVSRLPEHAIAYAITVHKSQGSEFGNVLVVLPDVPGHPLLTRRMVYTAITRARLRSVIFSTRSALASIV